MEDTIFSLAGGKYTIIKTRNEFKALRNGEEWRDLTGDNLILALVARIEDLEMELLSIKGVK